MSKIKTSRKTSKADTVVAAAAVLFRENGYRTSSMRELAEKLGIEAPSLYNHIGGKSQMLEEICRSIAIDFDMHISELEKADKSPQKKLELLIRFHIKMMLHNYDRMFVANHEWRQLSEPHLSKFLQDRKNYEQRMVQIVKEGILQKTFKSSPPQVTVLTILSALRGLEFWHKYSNITNTKKLENSIVSQLLTGIVA